ncbi:MAG: AAA family ATPase, partial [Cytophagales bacterium]|nr:AAA family ATPase [Cytophagales bacterium]
MKINKIYLKNLNALRGEHTIDFSQSPLRESDLVAIVGPTGAGKSTLLDAVLLSLYNKTPRFDKVSANELQDTGGLVTRGEKEAAAAIDFEVRKNGELKNYRAQWSASKGKKGEAKHRINSYSMTLSEIVADGGEILASGRASKVVPLVEKIIGLHYDQFVKAVMLSQGEFARLLKADKKERNQLLEKVTRSFDFREISKKAFEVHKEKKEALDERLRDLARYEILEEDEKKTIETRLANLAKAGQERSEQLEVLRKSLELWESRRKLGGELDSIQAKQQLLEERKTAFQAKSLQLNRYDQALPFQADWKNLAERQKQLTGKKAEIKALLDKKALAEKRLEQLSENKAKAEQSLNEEAAKRQAYEGLWEAVKAQDLQISKKQVEAAEAEKQVQALEKKCAEREKELLEKKEEKEKVGQELVEAESWLKQHAVLENLQSDWGKLEALFSQLGNYRDQFENECRQVSDFKAGEQIRLALEDNRLEDSLEDWKQKIKQKISEVEQARFFPDWGAEAYDPAIHLLEKSTVAEKEYEAVRKICDEQIQSQLDVQKKIEILLVELTAAETLERHALLSVEELQPKVERLKLENSSTVLGLRKELKEGVPCRVCGSIEHPFAEKPDDSSLISQAEDELAKAKKQHTDRQQKLAELRQNKSAEEAKQQA